MSTELHKLVAGDPFACTCGWVTGLPHEMQRHSQHAEKALRARVEQLEAAHDEQSKLLLWIRDVLWQAARTTVSISPVEAERLGNDIQTGLGYTAAPEGENP